VREFHGNSLAIRLDVRVGLAQLRKGLSTPSLIPASSIVQIIYHSTKLSGWVEAELSLVVRGARTSHSPTKPTTTMAQFCDAKPNHQEEAQEHQLNPEWYRHAKVAQRERQKGTKWIM